MSGYYLDPLGVLFHPSIDAENNFQTIVYNWRKDKILKIDRFGYEILRIIDRNPGINPSRLFSLVSQFAEFKNIPQIKITKFLDKMARENIVLEK